MRTILVPLGVFALALLQVSFLPHLLDWAWMNVVLISLLAMAPFVSLPAGTSASLGGGFLLDAYSSSPFGFWMLLSLFAFFSARYVFQHYVRLPQRI